MATPSPHPAVNVGLNMWKELVTPNVANTHLILYSALFGSHLWHGFIAGPIGFKTLPRQTFGLLQSKLFPAFFGAGTVVPAALIANLLISVGGRISTIPTFPLVNLAIISITNAVNWLYLGPKTTRIMFERHRLEKEEGIDAYKDKDKASPKMQQLSKTFAKLHGISSVLNLVSFASLVIHGSYLANYAF